MIMSADLKAAYKAGWMACENGKSGAACPHLARHGTRAIRLRKKWLDGWFAAPSPSRRITPGVKSSKHEEYS